jgi:hypothetical protein
MNPITIKPRQPLAPFAFAVIALSIAVPLTVLTKLPFADIAGAYLLVVVFQHFTRSRRLDVTFAEAGVRIHDGVATWSGDVTGFDVCVLHRDSAAIAVTTNDGTRVFAVQNLSIDEAARAAAALNRELGASRAH